MRSCNAAERFPQRRPASSPSSWAATQKDLLLSPGKFAGPWPRACQITGLWKETIRKETSAITCLLLFQIPSKNEQFSRNGLRNNPFQDKGSEMDSEMSTCSCFLLRQLFLVQKTAHARGAVREPRATVIGLSLRRGRDFFLKRFLKLKITIFEKHGSQNGPKMKTLGNYFSEKVQN